MMQEYIGHLLPTKERNVRYIYESSYNAAYLKVKSLSVSGSREKSESSLAFSKKEMFSVDSNTCYSKEVHTSNMSILVRSDATIVKY